MEPTEGGYRLSTGREFYAFHGVIGMSPDDADCGSSDFGGSLPYGSDGGFEIDEWTLAERVELADYMLGLWRRFRTAAAGEAVAVTPAADRIGFLWWCGGRDEAAGRPEIRIPAGHTEIEAALTFCTGCGRAAPFVNGCRWIEAPPDTPSTEPLSPNEALRALRAMNPFVYAGGGDECLFCGTQHGMEHERDCVWLRAQASTS
jgi:hypothetical protein